MSKEEQPFLKLLENIAATLENIENDLRILANHVSKAGFR